MKFLLFLQRNFMLNPVRLPKHTSTQKACDRWQILLKCCYVHKSFAPAWGEAVNRSRLSIEPVSAWAAPRRENIRLQAAESRYDKLCALSQSVMCVCVLSLSHHFRDQPSEITGMSMAHWWVLQWGLPAKIKSLILCLSYLKVNRGTSIVLMSLCKLKPQWKIE